MRRISEIICDNILSCCELNRTEHGKMDEFERDHPDFKKIMELDFLMRKNNELRRSLWNELNEGLSQIIRDRKYEWENSNNR